MSTYFQVITQLDSTTSDERRAAASAVAAYLAELGVVSISGCEGGFAGAAQEELDAYAHDESQEVCWRPGPAWASIVVRSPGVRFSVDGHDMVCLTSKREVQSAYAGFDPPTCQRCLATLDDTSVTDGLIESWLANGVEPQARCPQCGCEALFGDWQSDRPMALVGGPTLSFQGWPELSKAFVAQVIARLGAHRSRYFVQQL